MKKLRYSMMLCTSILLWLMLASLTRCTNNREVYIDINGSDSLGDGSSAKPWRTLEHGLAKVPADGHYTIRLSKGIFTEKAYLQIPPGTSLIGAGPSLTVIKAAPNLQSRSTQWLLDHFLITLDSKDDTAGDQRLSGFAIDGNEKQLYGGILVRGRSRVVLDNIHLQDTYYTGIWIWETKDCQVLNLSARNCAWAGPEGASAAILITASDRLEIGYAHVDENAGYGLKALGDRKIDQLKLHDSRISVHPYAKVPTGDGNFVANLAAEFYNVELSSCEIYNNTFENGISVVMDKQEWARPTGRQTVRIYNNTFDLLTRAKGYSQGLHLNLHDVEVDHNYFYGGATSIVNWGSVNAHTRHNWNIHHNIFFGLSSYYPSAVIALFKNGLANASICNNTVELNGTSTINFIEVNNGGVATNVKIKNNLIINSNTDYKWYPNKIISLVNQATLNNTVMTNNFFESIALDSISGIENAGNHSGEAAIQKKGQRPQPYYELTPGSNLIDAGENVGFKFSGKAPDIGALEQ